MPPFLQKFFPDVYEQTQNPEPEASPYCSYDNQLLTLFTSSLFLAVPAPFPLTAPQASS
jgi:hypothetical protein